MYIFFIIMALVLGFILGKVLNKYTSFQELFSIDNSKKMHDIFVGIGSILLGGAGVIAAFQASDVLIRISDLEKTSKENKIEVKKLVKLFEQSKSNIKKLDDKSKQVKTEIRRLDHKTAEFEDELKDAITLTNHLNEKIKALKINTFIQQNPKILSNELSNQEIIKLLEPLLMTQEVIMSIQAGDIKAMRINEPYLTSEQLSELVKELKRARNDDEKKNILYKSLNIFKPEFMKKY